MDSLIQCRKKKRFGDYLIFWKGELNNANEVIAFIEANINQWMEEDSPSLWIRLKDNDLSFLVDFMKYDFKMHRIKNGNILVLNKWIRKTSYTLPPAPFSYLGVGVLCYNHEGKVLAVRENYKTGPGPWKFPGGLFDPTKDKNLSQGAIRECLEETGIHAKFEYVALQRFCMNSSCFHYPDIYSVCKLTPLTEEIKYDPVEIADCQWLDPQELIDKGHPFAKPLLEAAQKAKTGPIEIFNEKTANSMYVIPDQTE